MAAFRVTDVTSRAASLESKLPASDHRRLSYVEASLRTIKKPAPSLTAILWQQASRKNPPSRRPGLHCAAVSAPPELDADVGSEEAKGNGAAAAEQPPHNPNGAATNGASTNGASASNGASTSEAAEPSPKFYAPAFELLAASKVVPHPDKVEKGGEDAFLISDVGAGVICVADGVGGWANDGVDPAWYSKELMSHLQAALDAAECQEDLEPKEVLRRAHVATKAEGAATAIVAVYDGEEGALNIANLGDSGLLVVRQGEVVFRTDAQQHYFDCPFQLGSQSDDSAEDAETYSVPLQEGDTIVMGSDGLFDNVFDKDIACVVKVFGGADSVSVQRAATALAALASKHAADPEYMSPYTLEAIEEGHDVSFLDKMMGKKMSGGKLDDITVVVAQVVKSGQGIEAPDN